MTRIWIGLTLVIAALVTGIATQASFDAQKQSGPPRLERPKADVIIGTPNNMPDIPSAEAAIVFAFYEEQARLEQAAVTAYLDSLEATRVAAVAEAARVAATRPAPIPQPASSGTGGPSSCDGHVVPSYIVQRESGCNYGAVNGSGCGGSGCYGLYQIAGFHWNGGACSDLNWTVPADQDTCAARLSNGGTNLAPWGG